MKVKYIVIVFFFCISSCALVPPPLGPIYQEAPLPKEGEALVYLYRHKDKEGPIGYTTINVDEKPTCTLLKGNYCFLYLKEGLHRFGVKYSSWGPEKYIEHTVQSREVLYVESNTFVKCMGCAMPGGLSIAYGTYEIIEKEKALAAIASCRIRQQEDVPTYAALNLKVENQ